MAKGSGSTRTSSPIIGSVNITTNDRGYVIAKSSEISSYNKEIGKLTYNLSQKYGQVSNALNNDTISFKKGTSDSVVRSYVKDALEGAKLYRSWDNDSTGKLDTKMDAWRIKMRNKQ